MSKWNSMNSGRSRKLTGRKAKKFIDERLDNLDKRIEMEREQDG